MENENKKDTIISFKNYRAEVRKLALCVGLIYALPMPILIVLGICLNNPLYFLISFSVWIIFISLFINKIIKWLKKGTILEEFDKRLNEEKQKEKGE